MSEADKIIKSLRDSGKKVEEFYMSNKTSDKNVANIEDDVRIVKAFIDYAQEVIDDMEYERPVDVTVYQKDLTSMQNILAEREQKDKRIQELEAKLLDMIQGTEIINKETPEYVKENYIPKQVIKDKIEKIIGETTPTPILKPKIEWQPWDYERVYKIQPLFELLEGEK